MTEPQLTAVLTARLGQEVKLGFTSSHLGDVEFKGTLVSIDAQSLTLESLTGEDCIPLATLRARGGYVAAIETGELDDSFILV